MVFSAFFFLFCFLPIAIALYTITPQRFKNGVLLVISIIFYAWSGARFLPILLGACVIDYTLGRYIIRARAGAKRRALIAGLAVNLALLGYCKYANFFVAEFQAFFGATTLFASWTAVALPLGISFFTFHKISYLVDLYRGRATGAENFFDYLLYIFFFPQLIAGPIIRYEEIHTQLRSRAVTQSDRSYGVWRFSVGLAKKVLIADSLGGVADTLFALPPGALTPWYAWLAVLTYSLQIYFDFSGYSDMAVGLARLFGFSIIENFERPYLARNFTEFWRRWHISLSHFMREYVYIPLGGNKAGAFRAYLNLWIVFLLSGLWHGASWNFIVWGAFHGLFLTVDKVWGNALNKLALPLQQLATFFLVTIGWIFFRATDLSSAGEIILALFGLLNSEVPMLLSPAEVWDNRTVVTALVAALIVVMPHAWWQNIVRSTKPTRTIELSRQAMACVLFMLSAIATSGVGFSPFLYFKF
jgi:alginate O-acetyltransferase complex protein AlgI